jgi:hypothetical protein
VRVPAAREIGRRAISSVDDGRVGAVGARPIARAGVDRRAKAESDR